MHNSLVVLSECQAVQPFRQPGDLLHTVANQPVVRVGGLFLLAYLPDQAAVADERRLLRDLVKPRLILRSQIVLQEETEKALRGLVGKAHEALDDAWVILTEEHVKIIQVAEFYDGMACGQPVHVDQQGLATLEKHVARVEIAVHEIVPESFDVVAYAGEHSEAGHSYSFIHKFSRIDGAKVVKIFLSLWFKHFQTE